jgi:hypothetical protein
LVTESRQVFHNLLSATFAGILTCAGSAHEAMDEFKGKIGTTLADSEE